jgi:polyhydroxyalkanoate synthase
MTDTAAPQPPRKRPPRTLRRLEKGAIRAMSGFVNGIEWLQRDPTDVVDRTPFDIVHQDGKLLLRRYRPLVHDDSMQLGTEVMHVEAPRQRVPVLLIPPLMVRPFIFDLTHRRSLVRTLLREGFDVYLVDFGVPDRADVDITLDSYVLNWVPQAVDAVCRVSGQNGLTLFGYCMGGLFALMHTSVHRDERIKAIVTIGSPVNAHKMGPLSWLVRVGHDQIDFLAKRMGNIPGPVSSTAFRLTSPWKSVTRYSDLFVNLWNDEYVQGFDAVSAWTGNFIDYPGEAFRQVLNDFMGDNKLMDGRWTFGGRAADLGAITCPILAFAGSTDKVVPAAAAAEILQRVGSSDKTFVEVPGGHMGVFAGREAPRLVWQRSARWLVERTSGQA